MLGLGWAELGWAKLFGILGLGRVQQWLIGTVS